VKGKKGTQFWILDFGFWILDFGFWILDFGFWILDFGFEEVNAARSCTQGCVRSRRRTTPSAETAASPPS
jgi:hypothetical protein